MRGTEPEGNRKNRGIAGVCKVGGFGRSPLAILEPAETLQRMLKSMMGEEPAEVAVWLSPAGAALGSLPVAGQQILEPTSNEAGTLWLVAEGEILNAGALRTELAKRHQFRTESDLEVILHLVEEMGPEGLDLLEGSFACALWGPGGNLRGQRDFSPAGGCLPEDRPLILARDPLGAQPLYYGKDAAGDLLFASSVEALAPEVERVEMVQPGARWAGAVPHRRGESRFAHVI